MYGLLAASFCLGACLGSFANVCIWRLPRPGLTPWKPARSVCPRCGAQIKWYDNIPIVSWFLLGGLCRTCGGAISFRYTVVEILTGVLIALTAWSLLHQAVLPGLFVWWSGIALGLVISAFIDLELMLLPDEIILPLLGAAPYVFLLRPGGPGPGEDPIGISAGLWVSNFSPLIPNFSLALLLAICWVAGALLWGTGLMLRRKEAEQCPGAFSVGAALALGGAVGVCAGYFLASPQSFSAGGASELLSSLLGAASGALVIGAIRVGGRYAFAQEAMGFGDVKLAALLGCLAGPAGMLWTVVVASLLGSLVGVFQYVVTGRRHLPFGPFLILGAAAGVFAREPLQALLSWYGRLLAGGG